jgi:hypothetical protein
LDGIEHGAKANDAGRRRHGEADIRGQRSDVRGQGKKLISDLRLLTSVIDDKTVSTIYRSLLATGFSVFLS